VVMRKSIQGSQAPELLMLKSGQEQ
jgi:hypothetical protein